MDEEDGLFSFRGRIGVARFWQLLFATCAAAFVINAFFPVSQQRIALGDSSAIFFPTSESWIALAAHLALIAPVMWVLIAAAVKRLHDLGRSGKWLATLPLAILLLGTLDATLSSLGLQKSTIVVIVMILMLPLCPVGAWVMFEVLFLPPKKPAGTPSDASDIV